MLQKTLDASPESVIMESVLEGMAHYYSANLSREVSKGMKETALQCKFTGGTPPLGYNVGADQHFVINEEEKVIIESIFKWYLEGYGYNAILDFINERGWKTKRGGNFSKGAINNILKNEKYKGVYKYNQVTGRGKFAKEAQLRMKDEEIVIRIENGMPAIISEEDFQAVQEKLQANKSMAGSEKAKKPYLLTGVIFCGECGASMQGVTRSSEKKVRPSTYRCSCRQNKRNCNNKEIRRDHLEEYVLDNLESLVLNESIVPQLVDEINAQILAKQSDGLEDIELYERRLKEVERKIDKLIDAIAEGISASSLSKKLDVLEQQKEEFEVKLESLKVAHEINKLPMVSEEEVLQLINKVKQYVVDRNIPECKKFIRDFVKRVDVYQDHVEVTFNVAFSVDKLIEAEKITRALKTDIEKISKML
ncbi:MAG: recombinase family protein [Candidatus Niameybacter stercoravium]|nr:recombinase family protein [Candidatus Niameybacter stercoravium]